MSNQVRVNDCPNCERLDKERGQACYDRDACRSVVDAYEREAKTLRARVDELEVELDTHGLKRERDEARDAARQCFEAAALWGKFPAGGRKVWMTELMMRWPWLKGRRDS